MLAHGVWLDRAELELIAERGCTIVANPVANMKLAVGGVLPLSGGPAGGSRGRPRHRRCRVQRLARPPLGPQGLRPRPAPGRGRPDAILPADEAWASRPAPARPCSAPASFGSGNPRTFSCCDGSAPELSLGDLHADLVYAAERLRRRYDRGRRAGADAGRRGSGTGRDRRPGRGASSAPRHRLITDTPRGYLLR